MRVGARPPAARHQTCPVSRAGQTRLYPGAVVGRGAGPHDPTTEEKNRQVLIELHAENALVKGVADGATEGKGLW